MQIGPTENSHLSRKVPELSLQDYLQGHKNEKARFVDQFYQGLQDYGFIVLNDHPVQHQKVEKAYALAKELFALPVERKMEFVCKEGAGQRGYTAFGREHARDSRYPDLKEFWHVGREVSDEHPYRKYYPRNLWPKEIAAFQETFLELYQAMDYTGQVLLDALSEGLGTPPHYFREMIKDGNSVLRVIHYPPLPPDRHQNSLRAAPHGDINLITLLVGATDSGLELLDRDGTWLPVQSNPGQIVVDSGDMLSRITNDVIPTTIHRVVNPQESNKARYSMPFFVHPHAEAILKCLPQCVGTGAKYPEISSHAFLEERLREIGLRY